MKIYIRSSASVSPQNTFDNIDFLTEPAEYYGTRLAAIDPDYSKFIDTKAIRRMSHVIKMGVASAKACLNQAEVEMPGAIITGTAFGCLDDTVSFLTRMIEMNEEMLPPTSFIQSTHNTVAAQIALLLKCHNYNSNFVHKGISFESALLDAVMLLNENEADNILVGGTEELTDTSFTILTRLGLYKRWPVNNLSIFNTQSKGSIGGEGAVFFLLSDKENADNLAVFKGIQTFYKPENIEEVERKIVSFLKQYNLTVEDIDLIITGKNGDLKNDAVYDQLNQSVFSNVSLANFKHLCGEYPTASSFGLWLAANIIKRGEVPAVVIEDEVNTDPPKKVLIYNHYFNTYHSLMLLTAC